MYNIVRSLFVVLIDCVVVVIVSVVFVVVVVAIGNLFANKSMMKEDESTNHLE